MTRIVHCAEMPWGESLVAQRGATDGMAHKRLFEGDEASADNFMLVMSREPATYFSPRHRHPWDQIRYCLSGKIPIARGLHIEGGEIGYFPESAHYGPQEGGEDRVVVLLQFGGASGQGFIGPDALKTARLAMEREGTFERGVYRTQVDGTPTNRDAYEAVWHHVKGRAPAYVPPVYKAPIVMRPQALGWRDSAEAGVARKAIGVFPHRDLTITGWRLAPGARHDLPGDGRRRFLFVNEGEGRIGDGELHRWSALHREPGEAAASIEAITALELVEFALAPVAAAAA